MTRGKHNRESNGGEGNPAPGARIDDFTIAYRISQGMNADVFAVWHHELRTPLVCKRLRPRDANDKKWRALLRLEGAALGRMRHPGIVRLIEQRQQAELPYLLLEHVGERTLRDVLREDGPLDADAAVRVVQHVGAAVAHAHAHGFLHRDLKPSNVVLRGGRPVLLDFGVAWRLRLARRPLDFAGTPQYLAPEQIMRETLSPATDVHGLGVLLFELVSGARPFRLGDESAQATLAERYPQLAEKPCRIEKAGRALPKKLAPVIRRCLEPNPRDRYQEVAELLCALDSSTRVKIWPRVSFTAPGVWHARAGN